MAVASVVIGLPCSPPKRATERPAPRALVGAIAPTRQTANASGTRVIRVIAGTLQANSERRQRDPGVRLAAGAGMRSIVTLGVLLACVRCVDPGERFSDFEARTRGVDTPDASGDAP